MKKLAQFLLVVFLSTLLIGGLVSAQETEMKTYTNKDFGFSISYPESWNKKYRDREDEPYPYLELSSTDPLVMVTVTIIELAHPTSLNELKRYRELHAQIFNGSWEEIEIEEFAGFQAVTSNFTHTGEKLTTGEDGFEKPEQMEWKGQWIGLIKDGYLYRITTRVPQEELEVAREKYLSRILDSFEFTK